MNYCFVLHDKTKKFEKIVKFVSGYPKLTSLKGYTMKQSTYNHNTPNFSLKNNTIFIIITVLKEDG